MAVAGDADWDGLKIRVRLLEPKRPIVAGESRRLVIEVENPSIHDRTGKLVHGSVLPEADDLWIVPERFTVLAGRTYTFEVADFRPVIAGRYYWSLFTSGSFEGNETVGDADLRRMGTLKGTQYRPVFSFRVHDKDELEEKRSSARWEWLRWAILIAITLAGTVAAYLLLDR